MSVVSLFQEQFSEVLDGMFEVLVKPQEHIIDQGDDGDNFYVIERCVCVESIFFSVWEALGLIIWISGGSSEEEGEDHPQWISERKQMVKQKKQSFF